MFKDQLKYSTRLKLLLTVCAMVMVPASAGYAQEGIPELEQPVPMANDITQDENLDFLTGEGALPDEVVPVAEESVAEDIIQKVDENVLPVPDPVELEEPKLEDDVMPALPEISFDEGSEEDLFFDSDDLVPSTEMGKKGGPRKVDPAQEPASKLILVRKNARASSADAQIVAAQRALKLGRYGAALEMFNRLAEKRSRDSNVLLGRATALQQLGRTQEAILAYQAVLDLRPNVDAEINMLGLMSKQYPAVALQRLMELRDQYPDNVPVVAQIAVVQNTLGRYNDALQYLGIASSMEPHNANHLYNIAIVADRAGNKKEAVKYYEQALEVDTIYGSGRTIPRDVVYERLAQIR